MKPKDVLALVDGNQTRAAQLCGVSRNTLRIWMLSGEIPVESQLRLQAQWEKTGHPLKAELPYGFIATRKVGK